ncbi:hypothetical protein [Nocardiopsis sp. CNS-639]|uniref:hypothetical protein n=1 Tax=Nocardiopsis sp. CNS-639 TaxID=1169153 RepID=UPI0003696F5D|nr:hypothetical protein [Nocardiopsis sp. CNS-639]
MRYLLLIASALWLVARAAAHAVRRRGARVRRYAAAPLPPRPHVITGPIPLILPSQTTGTAAPPLPAPKALPWRTLAPAPAPIDVLQRRCGQPSGGRHRDSHRGCHRTVVVA